MTFFVPSVAERARSEVQSRLGEETGECNGWRGRWHPPSSLPPGRISRRRLKRPTDTEDEDGGGRHRQGSWPLPRPPFDPGHTLLDRRRQRLQVLRDRMCQPVRLLERRQEHDGAFGLQVLRRLPLSPQGRMQEVSNANEIAFLVCWLVMIAICKLVHGKPISETARGIRTFTSWSFRIECQPALVPMVTEQMLLCSLVLENA